MLKGREEGDRLKKKRKKERENPAEANDKKKKKKGWGGSMPEARFELWTCSIRPNCAN